MWLGRTFILEITILLKRNCSVSFKTFLFDIYEDKVVVGRFVSLDVLYLLRNVITSHSGG